MYNFRNSDLILEAKKSKFIPRTGVLFIIAIVVYYVTQYISALPLSVILGIILGLKMGAEGNIPVDESGQLLIDTEEYQQMIMDFLTSKESTLITLLLTGVTIIACIIFCKGVEKRSMYSMGFVKKKALPSYILGLLTGFLMLFACYLICAVTGALEFKGINSALDEKFFILFFVAFIIQGAAEEIFMRGFLMISAARNSSVASAVILNSVIFAFLHYGNTGFGLVPLLNLLLFGIFASLYMLRSGNIWGVCAIHTAWNFAQGNIFGLPVSGINVHESLFLTSVSEIRASTNGGEFGLEGGVAVSLVLLISIMLVVFLPSKNNQPYVPENKEDLKPEGEI